MADGTLWNVAGNGGRLRAGSRPAAVFGKWEASYLGGRCWRITAKLLQSDPYWLEHGSHFKATLKIGRGEMTTPVEVVMVSPSLIFDLEAS